MAHHHALKHRKAAGVESGEGSELDARTQPTVTRHVYGHHRHSHSHGRNVASKVRDNRRQDYSVPEQDQQQLRPRQAQPTVVVATVIQVVLENGSTVAQFTVPTLPATVSNSQLGMVTIPAEPEAPIVVPHVPAPAASGPDAGTPVTNAPAASPVASSLDPDSPTDTQSDDPSDVSPPVPMISQSDNSPQPSPAPSDSNRQPASDTEPVSSISGHVLNFSSTTSSSDASAPSTEAPASEPSASTEPSSNASETPSPTSDLVTSDASSLTTDSDSDTTATPSSSSASSDSTSSASTTSSQTSTAISSETSSSTGSGYANPTNPGIGGAPTPTDAGSDASGSGVDTPSVVGGVIGGVAGVVLLLLAILFFIRYKKRKATQGRSLPPASGAVGSGSDHDRQASGEMSQRSSPLTVNRAFASAGVFNRWRNSGSSYKALESPTSEKGFQKLAGRKITSVLESGGDGYDTFGSAAANKEVGGGLARRGTASSSGSSNPPSRANTRPGPSKSMPVPPLGRPPSQESDSSEKVVVRPSPARTPMTSSADVSSPAAGMSTAGRTATTSPLPPLPVAARRDAIGRSNASADGSRTSRFTEGV